MLTLRLGAVVVEVLLPLGGDQLAHIPDKQVVAAAVRAEPVWTECVHSREGDQWPGICACVRVCVSISI